MKLAISADWDSPDSADAVLRAADSDSVSRVYALTVCGALLEQSDLNGLKDMSF